MDARSRRSARRRFRRSISLTLCWTMVRTGVTAEVIAKRLVSGRPDWDEWEVRKQLHNPTDLDEVSDLATAMGCALTWGDPA